MTNDLSNTSDERILEVLLIALPVIQSALDPDAGVTLTDREKFLLYKAGQRLDLKVPHHAPVKPGSGVYRAIHEKRRIDMRFDASLYGIPYTSTAVPVYNDKAEVIGAIAITQSIERQEQMKVIAGQLLDSITTLASTVQEISAQSEEIATISRSASDLAAKAQTRIKETDSILGLIRDISGQTNLLGLNAAIEAARVGEQGRGFGVVADEIRKLATSSSDSVKQIDAIIKAIQGDSSINHQQMIQIDGAIAQVSQAITQTAGTTQELAAVVQRLEKIAEEL